MFMDLLGEELKPKYTNDISASFNSHEFFVRFGVIGGAGISGLHTEIIATPVVAKSFLKLLENQVGKFEKANGTIYLPQDVSGLEGLFGNKIITEEKPGE